MIDADECEILQTDCCCYPHIVKRADVVETYQLGVNRYIVKPVDCKAFVVAVRTPEMYWLLPNQRQK